MLDDNDWKVSTDRALANTESILRSIGSRQRAPLSAFQENTHSSILDGSVNASFSGAPKPVISEVDRMYVTIKSEMDARCSSLQRSTEALRDEVRGEFSSRLVDLDEKVTDLRRLLADERERRSKSEKQMQELLRWKEQALFSIEDLRRKVDDMEEARGGERREMRKELGRRQEEANAAQGACERREMRKELGRRQEEANTAQTGAGGERREMRKELGRRQEEANTAQATLRKEMVDLVRTQLAAGGSWPALVK
ncbi:hypothetical protein T484DRAFT_1834910 [Baffinella frigidus]|nr:hypothetical protein T484DRAFT_1834910 [Cryptophyta sp. CCMP2293]